MGFEAPLQRYSWPAATDLSAAQFLGVKVAASAVVGSGVGNAALSLSDGTTAAIGVLQNNPVAGEAGEVTIHGITKVVAGGTLAIGDLVYFDATGKVQKAVALSGNIAQGIALETAASSDITTIFLYPLGKQ